jgi:hypothetical protein
MARADAFDRSDNPAGLQPAHDQTVHVDALSLTRGSTGQRRMSDMLRMQSRRGENLLRVVLEPLAVER